MAMRPRTLVAAAVPVAIGSACAHAVSSFRPAPALAALVGALLLQIAANLANDVFDFEKGADDEHRIGPSRAVQSGLLTPRAVRVAIVVVLALALSVGVYLTSVAGFIVVAIGCASIVAALAYTGGPFPLGYHGLGDLFVLVFFGFVAVAGTAFVQVGHVPPLALAAAVPPGLLATAVLVVNNLRDRETDARTGKRTLAVRLGRRAMIAEHALCLAVAHAVPVALVVAGVLGPLALVTLLTVPWAIVLVRRIATTEPRRLDPLLGATARLLLVHGALFALGIALS
jgi:1,4-dihydroxy-2-naphthoate octaprenyltransferase